MTARNPRPGQVWHYAFPEGYCGWYMRVSESVALYGDRDGSFQTFTYSLCKAWIDRREVHFAEECPRVHA